MVKSLQKYILVLISFTLLSNVVSAQVEKGKSRLDIGKKPTTKASAQKLSFVSKPMPNEVKLDKPTVVNQYFRNALLNGSSKPTTAKADVVNAGSEKSMANAENADKLFLNDKISVSNIYPNPANDFAVIDYQITGHVNDASMSFYNLLGNEVANFELDKNDRKLKVPTTNWDSGVYLYQLVIDGKKVATKKLLVRHN
ncbi:T9SS type A sorting domain-containing protein [Emticicia soli]|uniref:T9SS type A sorting domain-containing protein n=1 Tax=Emticicia soli TaxID=2027878 RepID=A0ABW5J7T0_9BACT